LTLREHAASFDEAARRFHCAKAEQGARGVGKKGRNGALTVVPRRRALPHDLIGFVDLETGQLQVFDHPLGEYLPGIVWRVFLEQAAQQTAAWADAKPIVKAS
jgi:hypothetical protein